MDGNQTETYAAPIVIKPKKNYFLILLLITSFFLISLIFILLVILFPNLNPLPFSILKSQTISKNEVEKRLTYNGDLPALYQEVNKYLASKNRPLISNSNITKISDRSLLEKLESNPQNFLLIDIRETRETETLLRLNDNKNLKYIRLGDLVFNNFDPLPKNTEIVIIGFTENRERVAADYLKSEGYQDVKILENGLLKWGLDKLPTSINNYANNQIRKDDINTLIPYIKDPSKDTSIINFGPYGEGNITLSVMDSISLNSYITGLPNNTPYILKCQDNKSCYDASHFWYLAKDKIDIIGYTGYR